MISECDRQMLLMVKQTVFMKDFFVMKWQRRPAGSGAHLLLFVRLPNSKSCWRAGGDKGKPGTGKW